MPRESAAPQGEGRRDPDRMVHQGRSTPASQRKMQVEAQHFPGPNSAETQRVEIKNDRRCETAPIERRRNRLRELKDIIDDIAIYNGFLRAEGLESPCKRRTKNNKKEYTRKRHKEEEKEDVNRVSINERERSAMTRVSLPRMSVRRDKQTFIVPAVVLCGCPNIRETAPIPDTNGPAAL